MVVILSTTTESEWWKIWLPSYINDIIKVWSWKWLQIVQYKVDAVWEWSVSQLLYEYPRLYNTHSPSLLP